MEQREKEDFFYQAKEPFTTLHFAYKTTGTTIDYKVIININPETRKKLAEEKFKLYLIK